MVKLNKKEISNLYCELFYGRTDNELLEVLYKENGISRSEQDRRIDGGIQTETSSNNIKGSVAK